MIRLLTEDERPLVEALRKDAAGQRLPAASADVVGAFVEGRELVGVLGVETVVLLGPLVVRRDWRGPRQVPAQLVEHVRAAVRPGSVVAVYTRSAHVERLAREFGMELMPRGNLWMKEV